MTIICTAVFDCDAEALTRVESAHPELMLKIAQAADGLMLEHTRYSQNGRTMDIDVYATRADYDQFLAQASDFIKTYCSLAEASVTDTVWERLDA